jgi:hypothetical protein
MVTRRESLKLLSLLSASSMVHPLWAASRKLAAEPLAPALDATSPGNSNEPPHGIAPVFTWLTLGEVKPAGWIKEQMVRDLNHGFAGRLDELCREASSDIFVSHRNTGILENIVNAAKNNWWNGETEGNWRAGHIMLAYLSEDKPAMQKADDYVRHILSSQGEDGYLGVFAPDVRFSKPGELWTQACLLRGLLDYAELTGDKHVMEAVVRATDLSISVYSSGKTPLPSGAGGQGESHDLMISDVMERLFQITGDVKYRDFTVGLYQELSVTARGADTNLHSLLDLTSGFEDHGANTYETMRVPLWLWLATGRDDLGQASRNSFDKLSRYTEPSGSAVSEESVSNLNPDPTFTLYEYCATKEIQMTLESALQKTGVASLGDKIERIWFNAAQGSRLSDGTAITYLTSENRFHCDGLVPDGMGWNGSNGVSPIHGYNPAIKFSPTHTDVAVCCNPNAANVASLYVRGMWMRHSSGGLAALLYGPCRVSTTVQDVRVRIEERTHYPFENTVDIEIQPERDVEFPLLFRNPEWSNGTTVQCDSAVISREGAYWVVAKKWKAGDTVRLEFQPSVREIPAVNGEVALQYGALLFVQPIESHKQVIKTYPVQGFEDAYYLPSPGKYMPVALPASSRWRGFGLKPAHVTNGADPLRPFDQPVVLLQGKLIRQSDGAEVDVSLVPLGNAPTLRRVTFPITP